MWKSALLLIWLECLVLVLFIPMISNGLGLSEIIYQDNPTLLGLLPVILALTPLVLPFLWKSAPDGEDSVKAPRLINRGSIPGPLWVALWCTCFALAGGFNVREKDVQFGYASRGPFLGAVLLLTNQVIMISVGSILDPAKPDGVRKSWKNWTLVGVLIFTIVLSGSRGIILSWFLTLIFAQGISSLESSPKKEAISHWGALIRKTFSRGRLLAIGLMSFVFAVWGSLREQESNVKFSAILRMAEPYWYKAYMRFQSEGPAPELLRDVMERIASIPLRLVGFSVEGTIDGNNWFIEQYLGIPFKEGVSLPITLVGHGLLFGGPLGLSLFTALTAGIVYGAFRIYDSLPRLPGHLQTVFLGLVFSKVFFLYPKSLSGVFLVMYYENLRDFLVLYLICRFSGSR